MPLRLKKIKKKVNLPIEIDKTYTTKMSTGDKFLVKKITNNKEGKPIQVHGIYEKYPHLGICPINIERLIPESIDGEVVEVCPHCGEEIASK